MTSIPYPMSKDSVKRVIKEQFMRVVKDSYYSYLAIVNTLIDDGCPDSKIIRPLWIPSEINNGLKVNNEMKGANVECTYSQNGNNSSSFIQECNTRNIEDVVEFSYDLFYRLGLVGCFISNGPEAINKMNEINTLNDRNDDLPF